MPKLEYVWGAVGGTLMGIGASLAGGCASGALWRMGEGHLKLWVAGFFFALKRNFSTGSCPRRRS